MTFPLSKVVESPDVQAAIALVAERVTNHTTFVQDPGAQVDATYHEFVDTLVGDAVEAILRETAVISAAEWAA